MIELKGLKRNRKLVLAMIKEYNFRFDELIINQEEISSVLGYGDCPLPEPIDEYVEMALHDAEFLTDIRCAYTILEDVKIDYQKYSLLARKQELNVGKAVCSELKGADRLAFYVCTAGKTISEKSASLLQGDDPVLGYVYDVLGSIITEATGDRIQSFLKSETEINGDQLTNRYSPGYCQWPVSDQNKLFSFFHENICGVSLTDSSLMHPVKSISGVIGIGKNVKYREYVCTLCSSRNCIYRKI
jgi:hypothetical protein